VSTPFNATDDSPNAVDRVTLVNGRTFVLAGPDGAMWRASDGVVFEDLRLVSELRFRFESDSSPPTTIATEPLGVSTPSPFHAVFVSRADRQQAPDLSELYIHRLWVGRGVRHDIEIHNATAAPIHRTIRVHADTDFAHVFDMKAGRPGTAVTRLLWPEKSGLLVDVDDRSRAVELCASPRPTSVDTRAKQLLWKVTCPPHGHTSISLSFEPWWDGRPAGLAFPVGSPPALAWPAQRLESLLRLAPVVTTDDARLSVAVEASVADLASLRIFDREHADRVVVAAGAPWFMTLFGRDSLLTSWMVLPFLPDLARGTIDSLADLQGVEDRAETEEQPGKILHELRRHGGDAAFAHRGRYYGTVDATPLFLMVIGEAVRWGVIDRAGVRARWPAIRAATEWVRRSIRDGDGFLRYRRTTEVGLVNQGWKDSWDGISFADGRLPQGGLALAEVQGYAYGALLAAANLAEIADGEDAPNTTDIDADELRRDAQRLAERFDAAFWIERRSCFAVGLDGDDRQIDSVTTNPGHAIWSGITDDGRAHRYLDRIFDGALFSGWGLRTLAPDCARYDPLSYHNGSVWPHDTAIVAAGAARLGRRDVVERLYEAALDVTEATDGRPPELFAGVDREVVGIPVPYPSSCSPQAWASASTLLHLRSLLQLDAPDSPEGAPVLAPWGGRSIASLTGIHVGTRRYVAEQLDGNWECRLAIDTE
jgi:glycogen debranching enzyme